MHARFMIMAAALSLAAGTGAQPVKTPAQVNGQEPIRTTPVVLASADHVTPPTPSADPVATPVKRRAARVTTCRCGGDPQPEPQDQE
jgi:hypothetical protein